MRRRAMVVAAAVLTLLWPAQPAQARNITVPVSNMDQFSRTRVLNDFRPDQCSSINIEKLVVREGSASFTGTPGNDLILGGDKVDTISGGAGADCIVGGDGNDSLTGGGGTDVCLGGPGNDTFHNNCETKVQ